VSSRVSSWPSDKPDALPAQQLGPEVGVLGAQVGARCSAAAASSRSGSAANSGSIRSPAAVSVL